MEIISRTGLLFALDGVAYNESRPSSQALVAKLTPGCEYRVRLHSLEAGSLSDMFRWVSGQDLALGDIEEESK
jgi:hypothetical protein